MNFFPIYSKEEKKATQNEAALKVVTRSKSLRGTTKQQTESKPYRSSCHFSTSLARGSPCCLGEILHLVLTHHLSSVKAM